ncbi:Peptidase M23 [Stanieria cyanosphaera PCC 7437]|uniref:Peptidase M23 n=1 Tax=Stanieria cyanosphaera (strain ATCC 29371 / PCC 7437) TaxID=111780 RepID=K9XZF3_STAC7|nr:peptidoglycan DD-metalloendopeptidase family protein [Stanieria cyanosphaera]AFZ37419.1 Peptidase M23 [Stanieria cyanosphaera PCC 7437]
MQQNCPFASNLSISEASHPEPINQEPHWRTPVPSDGTVERPSTCDRKNTYSAAMFSLLFSLSTTGMFLMYHQQKAQAAVEPFVSDRFLSSSREPIFLTQNIPNLITVQPISSAQIFLNTQIVELPKLDSEVLLPNQSAISSLPLSSTVASPQQPTLLNKLKQKQLGLLNAEQTIQIADIPSANSSDFRPNAQIQPQTTVVILSNLDQSPHSVPQLPSLSVEKDLAKQIYTVKPGDTLFKIASLFNTSSEELIQTNQLSNPNLLAVNQQLIIPKPQVSNTDEVEASSAVRRQSTFENNSSLQSPTNLSASQSVPVASVASTKTNDLPVTQDPYIARLRADLDQLREQYQTQTRNTQTNLISTAATNVNKYNQNLTIQIGATINPDLPPLSSPEEYLPNSPAQFEGYLWPAQGTLTSGYGWRWGRMHQGIDIAGPIGTPIMAAATGEVVSAGWNSGGYGNLVKLKHPDGSVTLYAHNNKILVSSGQQVEQGQLIAEMGSTGFSTGPHLHFEIRPNGETAVNPIAFLPTK